MDLDDAEERFRSFTEQTERARRNLSIRPDGTYSPYRIEKAIPIAPPDRLPPLPFDFTQIISGEVLGPTGERMVVSTAPPTWASGSAADILKQIRLIKGLDLEELPEDDFDDLDDPPEQIDLRAMRRDNARAVHDRGES